MDWGPIVDVLQGVVLVIAAAGGVGGGGLLLHQRRQRRRDSERPPAQHYQPPHDYTPPAMADTAQRLNPVWQADKLAEIDRKSDLTAYLVQQLADKRNGHGAASREDLAAVEVRLSARIDDVRVSTDGALRMLGERLHMAEERQDRADTICRQHDQLIANNSRELARQGAVLEERGREYRQ